MQTYFKRETVTRPRLIQLICHFVFGAPDPKPIPPQTLRAVDAEQIFKRGDQGVFENPV